MFQVAAESRQKKMHFREYAAYRMIYTCAWLLNTFRQLT